VSCYLIGKELLEAYRIHVAGLFMVAYPLNMVISILPGLSVSIRAEWFLSELIRSFANTAYVPEDGMELTETSVAELEDIQQSRRGDSDAYRRLVERHQKHVGRILWRFSRDYQVHEELVQDVFVEAYLSLKSYRGKAPFAHWLSRIATRVGYRYWKQTARYRKTERFALEEWDQLPDESSQEMDPVEAASLVHRLLAQLRPRDRLVLTLRYLEGCDVAETSRRTGWTKSMVKVQTNRAKKRLEKLFIQSEREMTK
jgi:RNA polymerase sigma-70 factor (ECF subfamily)